MTSDDRRRHPTEATLRIVPAGGVCSTLEHSQQCQSQTENDMPKNTILPDGTDVDLSSGRLRLHATRGLCLYIYSNGLQPDTSMCFMFDNMESARVSKRNLETASEADVNMFKWFRDHENSRLSDTELVRIQSALQYLSDIEKFGLEEDSSALETHAERADRLVNRIMDLLS